MHGLEESCCRKRRCSGSVTRRMFNHGKTLGDFPCMFLQGWESVAVPSDAGRTRAASAFPRITTCVGVIFLDSRRVRLAYDKHPYSKLHRCWRNHAEIVLCDGENSFPVFIRHWSLCMAKPSRMPVSKEVIRWKRQSSLFAEKSMDKLLISAKNRHGE